jgi:hypothetical protein
LKKPILEILKQAKDGGKLGSEQVPTGQQTANNQQ